MKELLNTFQSNDSHLLSIIKAYIIYYITIQEQLDMDNQRDMSILKSLIDSIDVQTAVTEFITKNETGRIPVQDLVYDPYIPDYEKHIEFKDKEQIAEFTSGSSGSTSSSSSGESKLWNNVVTDFFKSFRKSTEPAMKKQDSKETTNAEKPLVDPITELVKVDQELFKWFDEFLEQFLDKKTVDTTQSEKALNYLKETDGRTAFSLALNKHRTNCCLEKEIFEQLGKFFSVAMSETLEKNDPHVGRILMNMSQTFYMLDSNKKKLYLQQHLKDHPAWTDIRFWEAAFYGK